MERHPKDDSETVQSSTPDDPRETPSSGGDAREGSSDPRGWIRRTLRHTEVAAAILLAIATVATAWCAYQATRWSGVQATAFAEASSDRIESNREFNFAVQLQSIDIELTTLWLEAYRADETERMEFYETSLMRPELQQHLDEWVASDPELSSEASAHPLTNDQYADELVADSERLRAEADAKFQEAKDANQTGDEYVLATVMFATVLFFAGIAGKFRSERIQGALVALGCLVLVAGAVQIGTLPVH